MKKILPLLLVLIFVLSACQGGPESRTDLTEAASSDVGSATFADPESVRVDASDNAESADSSAPTKINASEISRIFIRDSSGLETDVTDQNMIEEFCSLLENQKYTPIEKVSGEAYKAEFSDLSGRTLLTAIFKDNTVYFDHNITVGDIELSKGAYESSDWSWTSFSFYLKHYIEGIVMNPASIQYPASLNMQASHDDVFRLELIDKGNERVNTYDVYPMLYDFIYKSFIGNSFEITISKKYYDYEEFQYETDRTKQKSQCILVTFGSSDTRLPINSASAYDEFAMTYTITIAKNPDKPGIYKLITDRMVFEIKAYNGFSDEFDALFAKNAKADQQVTPDEIKELYDGRKPYYMEYVCKNLGIAEWNEVPSDRLEIGLMKLNPNSKPYTVVSISNNFNLRMLVYKQNADGSMSFIGDMDFRNWPNQAEYRLERTADKIWIAGTRYLGRGTGEFQCSQLWYRVTDTEVKPVLIFTYDDYHVGPYGGYTVKAKKVSLQKADSIKIIAEYDTSKIYNLYLDIADEYGAVELNGSKTVEFVWNEQQERFIAENEIDENDAFTILADTPEITKKCDELLKEHSIELGKVINGIPGEENEHKKAWRAESIKIFLNDCSDCPEKAALLNKLAEAYPE